MEVRGPKADYSEYSAALSEMAAELVENGIQKVASGSEEGSISCKSINFKRCSNVNSEKYSRPASGGEHNFLIG